jgi:hypothetical protein
VNNVVRLIDTAAFDFDALFESLKGRSYNEVLVITDNGDLDWFGNVKAGDAMLLMARLQDKLVKEVSED